MFVLCCSMLVCLHVCVRWVQSSSAYRRTRIQGGFIVQGEGVHVGVVCAVLLAPQVVGVLVSLLCLSLGVLHPPRVPLLCREAVARVLYPNTCLTPVILNARLPPAASVQAHTRPRILGGRALWEERERDSECCVHALCSLLRYAVLVTMRVAGSLRCRGARNHAVHTHNARSSGP